MQLSLFKDQTFLNDSGIHFRFFYAITFFGIPFSKVQSLFKLDYEEYSAILQGVEPITLEQIDILCTHYPLSKKWIILGEGSISADFNQLFYKLTATVEQNGHLRINSKQQSRSAEAKLAKLQQLIYNDLRSLEKSCKMNHLSVSSSLATSEDYSLKLLELNTFYLSQQPMNKSDLDSFLADLAVLESTVEETISRYLEIAFPKTDQDSSTMPSKMVVNQ